MDSTENAVSISYSNSALRGYRINRVENTIPRLHFHGRYLQTAVVYRAIT